MCELPIVLRPDPATQGKIRWYFYCDVSRGAVWGGLPFAMIHASLSTMAVNEINVKWDKIVLLLYNPTLILT